jgi:hypothetical protein
MGGIYEERRWDGLRCHDTHTKCLKISLAIEKLIDAQTRRQHGDRISLFLFFQNKNRLNVGKYKVFLLILFMVNISLTIVSVTEAGCNL